MLKLIVIALLVVAVGCGGAASPVADVESAGSAEVAPAAHTPATSETAASKAMPPVTPTPLNVEEAWGPVLSVGDLNGLPDSGIAIQVREQWTPGTTTESAPLAIVFLSVEGDVLGQLPQASFDDETANRGSTLSVAGQTVDFPFGIRPTVGSPRAASTGCSEIGQSGLTSCHRDATELALFPTLTNAAGTELVGLAQWSAFVADSGYGWSEDPDEWPFALTENILDAWPNGDAIALQMSGACEQQSLRVLHDGHLRNVVLDELEQSFFVGWLDEKRLAFVALPGCGLFEEPWAVATYDIVGHTVEPLSSAEASLLAVVWASDE